MSTNFKILMVSSNQEVLDYFELIVFKNLEATFETVVNIQHAKQDIEAGNIPDLIILELPQEIGLQEFFDEVDGKHQVPILFTADDNHIHLAQNYIPYHPTFGKISYNQSDKVVASAIKRISRIAMRAEKKPVTQEVTEEKEDNIYMELPIVLFLKSQTIDYDLYLKMSEEKYVKVFKKGEALIREDFLKYQQRNVRTVYLKSEDYVCATVMFSEKMSKALSVKKLRVEEYSALSIYSFDKVNKIVNKLGLREEVLILTNQVLELNTTLISKRKGLDELLQKTLKGDSYISEHSLLLTFITTSIAKYMGWPSVTTAEKLTLACFFHDICMEDDELAKLDFLDQKRSEKELQKLRSHPQEAIDLLDKFDGLPSDVEKIILQHHEKPDGTGFPRGLEWKRIYSLAAVFIVAEDFANAIFECGLSEINTGHLLADLEEKYSGKGNFSLAVEALKIAMGYSKPQTLQAA
ncbi:MAG: hypothetical protein CME70_17635 [Halobacteriovorax sp.]|nr:hypothetical protein [Halobacteriovorax sp.]